MMILLIVSVPIVVKEYVELGKRVLQNLVILLVCLLGSQALFFSLHNDWRPMRIRTTDECNINSHLLQESDKHVGRYVSPEVTNVHLAARVWKSTGHKHWIFGRIITQFSHTPLGVGYNLL